VSTLPSNIGEIGILTFKTYKESLKSVLNSHTVNLNHKDIEEYGNIIIKNCREYYSFKKRNLKHGEELLRLSSEQKDITKNLLNNKILLEGVAGSGKTMLAIEAARRAAENKQKTLVICHSSRLNQYLRDSLEDCKDYVHIETMQGHLNYLYTFIELFSLNPNFQVGEQVLKNEVHYLKIVRPAGVLSVIDKMFGISKYDFLIIDEAQDLLTENEMKVLSYSLNGAFKNGNWMICYDREQALFGEIDSGLSYLNQFQPDSKKLTVNIRNPRDNFKFAKVFSKVMDAQTRLKNYSTLNVIPYHTISEGKDILIEFMIKVVKKRNLQPQDITILSSKKKSYTKVLGSQSVIRKGKNSFKIKNLSKGTYEKGIVSFCEIDSYKGMENKCIVLTGIEDYSKNEYDQLIYIALTRATHMVLVLYPESARKGLLDRMVRGK
jgi:phosphate starvation-inducible protein PhoH